MRRGDLFQGRLGGSDGGGYFGDDIILQFLKTKYGLLFGQLAGFMFIARCDVAEGKTKDNPHRIKWIVPVFNVAQRAAEPALDRLPAITPKQIEARKKLVM